MPVKNNTEKKNAPHMLPLRKATKRRPKVDYYNTSHFQVRSEQKRLEDVMHWIAHYVDKLARKESSMRIVHGDHEKKTTTQTLRRAALVSLCQAAHWCILG